MKVYQCETFTADIYIAGSAEKAIELLRLKCMDVGLCVSAFKCDYVYSGGLESGMMIRLINYPRFPKTNQEVHGMAVSISEWLIVELGQWSATVSSPLGTVTISRRNDAQENPIA